MELGEAVAVAAHGVHIEGGRVHRGEYFLVEADVGGVAVHGGDIVFGAEVVALEASAICAFHGVGVDIYGFVVSVGFGHLDGHYRLAVYLVGGDHRFGEDVEGDFLMVVDGVPEVGDHFVRIIDADSYE